MTKKPRIAYLSGANATISNSPPLVTSNKARKRYGLPIRKNPDGSEAQFDVLRPQRLAAPVTVFVEQFSAHPLESDASELYGRPDGYIDTNGEAGIPCTIDDIEQRVDFCCGEGVFQPGTRLQLAYEVWNNYQDEDVIISWSNAKHKDYNIRKFMKDIKFVDYLWHKAEISDSGASFAGRFGAKFRVKLKSEHSAY